MRDFIGAICADDVVEVRRHIESGLDLSIDFPGYKGGTPLHLAVARGSNHVMEFLLGAGFDVNARDNEGWPPMFFLPEINSLATLKKLVESGADVTIRAVRGDTMLHRVARFLESTAIEYLVNLGLDVNAKDKFGQTPLGTAISKGSEKALEALVRLGADVDAYTATGATLIMKACMWHCTWAVPLLIEVGCNVEAVHCNGDTALGILTRYEKEAPGDYSGPIQLLSERLDFVVRKRRVCRSFMSCRERSSSCPIPVNLALEIMERVAPTQTKKKD